MLIDVEVALDAQRQIERAVAREELQHVIRNGCRSRPRSGRVLRS